MKAFIKSHFSWSNFKRQRKPTKYMPHIGYLECLRRRFQMGTGEFAGVWGEEAREMRRVGEAAHRARLTKKAGRGKILNRMIRGF